MKKREIIKLLGLSAALCMVGAGQALAGAWMVNEGESVASAGVSYSTHNRFYNNASVLVPQGCTSRNTSVNAGYEYGLSYFYNIYVNTGYGNYACAGRNTATGIGDVTVGIRGRLDQYRNGKTWEVEATFPTGYNKTAANRLGYGEYGIAAGVNFSNYANYGYEEWREEEGRLPFIYAVGAKVQFWTGAPSTQLVSYAQVGENVFTNDKVFLRADLRLSFRDGDRRIILPQNALSANAVADYDRLDLSLRYSHPITDDLAAHAHIGRTFWGRNTPQSNPFVGVGISYHWGNR